MPTQIQLTKGAICIVDNEDADLLQYKWSELVRGNNTYAKSTKLIEGKQRLIHVLVFSRVLGREPVRGEIVDHIDGNALNCQRGNLRLGNQSKNIANSRSRKNNTTGYKGVVLVKQTGKYEARIRVNYKINHLGCYDTPEEAYEVYKKAAIAQWGDFAKV